MKKIISVLLCIVLLSTQVFIANAKDKDDGIYPTIIVAGYSSPSLYLETPNGSKQVWGVNVDDILSLVMHNIADIGIGLGELAFGRAKYIADVVGGGMVDLYGVLACNPDGSSVNNIRTYSQNAADTQFSYLQQYQNGEHMHEPEIMASVAEEYEKLGLNGNDWIFSFQHDFRKNVIDSAAALDKFIDSVREFTGKDKVNIYAVSHGGEVTAVYLSLYGCDKLAVNNAVLTVPAIGGAALAYDVMSENIVFDEETLLYFIENGMMLEEDYNWLVRAHQFGILDDICYYLMHDHAKKILGYWGSIWDFIPNEYYDEMKNEWLDPIESAPLIAKCDIYQNEIMPNMAASLNECLEKGINISIVAGMGNPSVTGLQQQSDGIITVNDSTGSYCAPFGSRFADGYRQKREVCRNPDHDHLSPSMTVDASCAFLPENTWFIDGLFHGMTWKDDYTVELCLKLLFADSRIDIYSFDEYPQFKYSTNRCHTVSASFDNSTEGSWSGTDHLLTVKNLSHKYYLKINSVYCADVPVRFRVDRPIYLAPQQSADIAFTGQLPDVSMTTADITVYYTLIGNVTPFGYRTMTFTIRNGDAAVYDPQDPFTDAHRPTDFDRLTTERTAAVLKAVGLYDWLKMVFNSITAIFGALKIC